MVNNEENDLGATRVYNSSQNRNVPVHNNDHLISYENIPFISKHAERSDLIKKCKVILS